MAEGEYTKETIRLTEEQAKSRRARNYALALVLAAFIILMYVISWTKLGINLYNREL